MELNEVLKQVLSEPYDEEPEQEPEPLTHEEYEEYKRLYENIRIVRDMLDAGTITGAQAKRIVSLL